VISFVVDDPPISALDLGLALDAEGIAVRTGHHCCQPVMDRFGINATTRISLAMYNSKEEVDAAVGAVGRIVEKAKKEATKRSVRQAQDGLRDGAAKGSAELDSLIWPV